MKSSIFEDLRIDSSTSSSESGSEFSSPAKLGLHESALEKAVVSNHSTISSPHEGKGRRVFVGDSDEDDAVIAHATAKSSKVMQKRAFVSSDDDEVKVDSQIRADNVPSFLPSMSVVSRLEGNELIDAMSKAVIDYHESDQLTSFTLSPSNRRDEASDARHVDIRNNNRNRNNDDFSLPSSDELKPPAIAESANSTPEQHSVLTVEPTKLAKSPIAAEASKHGTKRPQMVDQRPPVALPEESVSNSDLSTAAQRHKTKAAAENTLASRKVKAVVARKETLVVRKEAAETTAPRNEAGNKAQKQNLPQPENHDVLRHRTTSRDTSYSLQEMYRRAVKHRKYQDEKRQELRNSLEARMMSNCTFVPKITEMAEAVQKRCVSADGSSKRGVPACFESAIKGCDKLRQIHDEKDIDSAECTFVPQIAPASVLLVKRARSAVGKVMPTDERLYLDSQRRAIELAHSVEVNLRQTLKQAPRRSDAEINNHITQLHEFQQKRERAIEKLRSEDSALGQYRSTSRDVFVDPVAVVERLHKRPASSRHQADLSDHTMMPKVNPISAALARKRRAFLLCEWFHYLSKGAGVLPHTVEFCDNALETEQLREAAAILTTLRVAMLETIRAGQPSSDFLTESCFVDTLEKYERMHGPQLWSSASPEAATKRLLEEEASNRPRGKVLTSKELNEVHSRLHCSQSKQRTTDAAWQSTAPIHHQPQQKRISTQQPSPSLLELQLRAHRDELRELSDVMRSSTPNVADEGPTTAKDHNDDEDDDILDALDRALRERMHQQVSSAEMCHTPPPLLQSAQKDSASEQKTNDVVSTLSFASNNSYRGDKCTPMCETADSDLLSECAKLTVSSTIATYDREERKKIEMMKRRRLRELGKLMAAAQLGALS